MFRYIFSVLSVSMYVQVYFLSFKYIYVKQNRQRQMINLQYFLSFREEAEGDVVLFVQKKLDHVTKHQNYQSG